MTYTVHAEDGSTKDYIVTTYFKLNSSDDLTVFSVKINESEFYGKIIGNSVSLQLPYYADSHNLAAYFTITGQYVTVNGSTQTEGQLQDFSSPAPYTVHAENGDTQAYVVIVTIEPEPIFTSFKLNNCYKDGVIDQTNGTIHAYFKTDGATEAIFSTLDPTNVVTVNGIVQTSGKNTINYMQNPQVEFDVSDIYGDTKKYIISSNDDCN